MCWKAFINTQRLVKKSSPPRTKGIGVKPIKVQFVIGATVTDLRLVQRLHQSVNEGAKKVSENKTRQFHVTHYQYLTTQQRKLM